MKASIYSIWACLIVLSSCSPVLYSNVGQNVPLFKEKGEFSGQVAYSGTDDASGLGLQMAYSASDHLLLAGSVYVMGNNQSAENWRGDGAFGEFAAGIYTPVQNKKFVLQVLGGLGFGGIKSRELSNNIEVNFTKPFVQPSLGFVTKGFEIALSPRIAQVYYGNKRLDVREQEFHQQLQGFLDRNHGKLAFEPGVTVRAGWEGVKFQVQYVHSNFGFNDGFSQPNFISGGLYFLLNEKSNKSK